MATFINDENFARYYTIIVSKPKCKFSLNCNKIAVVYLELKTTEFDYTFQVACKDCFVSIEEKQHSHIISHKILQYLK